MRALSYMLGKSTLMLLFKAARARLVAKSEDVGSLADTRIASATDEMTKISDDIRNAKGTASSDHAAAAPPANELADREITVSMTNGVSAAVRSANPGADRRLQVAKVATVDLSADTGGSVQWAGDYEALTGRREKASFVSELVALGYSQNEFRVTVSRLPTEGPDDTRQRYTVQVAQLQNGVHYRQKRYVGGHGAEWVDEFSRNAAIDFPHNAVRCDVQARPAQQ